MSEDWWDRLHSEPAATRPMRPVRRGGGMRVLVFIFLAVFVVTFGYDALFHTPPDPYRSVQEGN